MSKEENPIYALFNTNMHEKAKQERESLPDLPQSF